MVMLHCWLILVCVFSSLLRSILIFYVASYLCFDCADSDEVEDDDDIDDDGHVEDEEEKEEEEEEEVEAEDPEEEADEDDAFTSSPPPRAGKGLVHGAGKSLKTVASLPKKVPIGKSPRPSKTPAARMSHSQTSSSRGTTKKPASNKRKALTQPVAITPKKSRK